MTTLERWAMATLAAATVVAAGAGGPGDPGERDEQEIRKHIENMEPGDQRLLYDKQKRFFGLSDQKQEELRTLHRNLRAEENREDRPQEERRAILLELHGWCPGGLIHHRERERPHLPDHSQQHEGKKSDLPKRNRAVKHGNDLERRFGSGAYRGTGVRGRRRCVVLRLRARFPLR